MNAKYSRSHLTCLLMPQQLGLFYWQKLMTCLGEWAICVFLPVCLYSKYLWVGLMELTCKPPIYNCLSNHTLGFLSTVLLVLHYGQPVVSIPLPSTVQVCDISIKPLTETVEDLVFSILVFLPRQLPMLPQW